MVKSETDVRRFINQGNKVRQVAETNMNDKSSRCVSLKCCWLVGLSVCWLVCRVVGLFARVCFCLYFYLDRSLTSAFCRCPHSDPIRFSLSRSKRRKKRKKQHARCALRLTWSIWRVHLFVIVIFFKTCVCDACMHIIVCRCTKHN